MKTLSDITVGESAVVKKVENKGSIRRRLLDIGLIPGTKVQSVLKSPAGDPVAYLVRGAMIAIRREDAKHIVVGGV